MNITQQKGLTTELQCQLFFTQLGYVTSVPIAQDSRYDMIVDINNILYRIQVKTSRPLNTELGGCVFNAYSSRMNHTDGNIQKGYDNSEIDFFATFFENKVYLIPVDLCSGREKRLVKAQSKTANTTATLLEDYEGEKVINRILQNESFIVDHNDYIVDKFDLENNYIASYISYMDAARSVGKNDTGAANHISQVVRGMRKTAYNHIWKKHC